VLSSHVFHLLGQQPEDHDVGEIFLEASGSDPPEPFKERCHKGCYDLGDENIVRKSHHDADDQLDVSFPGYHVSEVVDDPGAHQHVGASEAVAHGEASVDDGLERLPERNLETDGSLHDSLALHFRSAQLGAGEAHYRHGERDRHDDVDDRVGDLVCEAGVAAAWRSLPLLEEAAEEGLLHKGQHNHVELAVLGEHACRLSHQVDHCVVSHQRVDEETYYGSQFL